MNRRRLVSGYQTKRTNYQNESSQEKSRPKTEYQNLNNKSLDGTQELKPLVNEAEPKSLEKEVEPQVDVVEIS